MTELFVEKYRPKNLDEFIGNDNIKTIFKEFIINQEIPNILLYGGAGSGKSTLAKILINSIDCDYIYINMSDENSIDVVRNRIKNFASSISFSKIKIIVGEESDYLTPNAQASLRNIISQFSNHTRFIFTCNYINKVIDPIISRCQTFELQNMSKTKVAERLTYILDNENVKYKLNDIKVLVNNYFPDVRRIINETQKSIINNNIVIDVSSSLENDYKYKVLKLLKEKNNNPQKQFNKIRQIIANNGVKDFSDMYTFLFNKIDEFCNDDNILYNIITIQEAQYQDSFSIDKEICFVSLIAQILKGEK